MRTFVRIEMATGLWPIWRQCSDVLFGFHAWGDTRRIESRSPDEIFPVRGEGDEVRLVPL